MKQEPLDIQLGKRKDPSNSSDISPEQEHQEQDENSQVQAQNLGRQQVFNLPDGQQQSVVWLPVPIPVNGQDFSHYMSRMPPGVIPPQIAEGDNMAGFFEAVKRLTENGDMGSDLKRPRQRKSRVCAEKDCSKGARSKSQFCVRHGGGIRCSVNDCEKAARHGSSCCSMHGGGPRCSFVGCKNGALTKTQYCKRHGMEIKAAESSESAQRKIGKRMCDEEGCSKSARSGTNYCVRHGGGIRCSAEDCEKAARPQSQFCSGHGGGLRCLYVGCKKGAISKSVYCKRHGQTSESPDVESAS